MATGHTPVMLEEAIAALDLAPSATVVDATFGGGGHSRKILELLGEDGRLVGIDRDPEAAVRASGIRDARFEFRPGAYDEVLQSLVEEGMEADAVLFDLGLSGYQIEDPERGFSYIREAPLDMRMDPASGISAAEFLNSTGEEEILQVLTDFGDVSRSEARRITKEIIRRRPISTTLDLTEAVRAAVGWTERGGNPSKRVFQAVRMRVNDELDSLERALRATERLLVAGGRLVVISFHSGEDRIVKRFIADREGKCTCPPELPVCVCGAKPIFRRGVVRRSSREEVERNPRSASARLRSAIRTGEFPREDST